MSFCRRSNRIWAAMFRFLFSKRGKGNISQPIEIQRTTENFDMPSTRTFKVLRPVFLVSVFTGYSHKNYRVQGVLGGFLWLAMLLAHATLDFLAARQVYTYGWASVSLSLFLVCFICTIFNNKKMLPWLEKGLSLLEEDKRYPKTMEKCQKVFKVGIVGVLDSWGDRWLNQVLKAFFLTHIKEKASWVM